MRIAATAALILFAKVADATVIQVPGDYPNVLLGVDAAAPGDTVLVGPGVWTETDTRVVTVGGNSFFVTAGAFLGGGITLMSEAGPEFTVLDLVGASLTYSVFVGGAAEPVVVDGFTFTGMTETGLESICAVIFVSDVVVFRACRFVDNRQPKDLGAAVVNGLEATLVFEDCELSRNRGERVVFVRDGQLEMLRCLLYGNEGGTVEVVSEPGLGAKHVFEDCRFLENKSDAIPGSFSALLIAGFSVTYEVRRCLFVRNTSTLRGGAIHASATGLIEFSTFAYDSTLDGGGNGGALYLEYEPVVVRHCTFVGCHAGFAAAIQAREGANLQLENSIFAHSTGGVTLRASSGAMIDTGCNDFWANEGADISGGALDPTDFSLDPEFCDLEQLDLFLHSTSPCAKDGACGQVGAWGVNCGPVSVESKSWGEIKSLYR